ncbi:MAG: tRNA (adenosine(37)-N6)-threonylcarbamoyltransferase complex ATPase subunit type 1 TsaE [Pseudomonadales bacterium]
MMRRLSVTVSSEEAMERLGSRLAHSAGAGDYIALSGELGAGKTTLARGALHGLGYEGVVKSPTYTIVESYGLGARTVHHLDLYRVAQAQELEYFGIWDYFDDESVKFVEWPERGSGVLPEPDVMVTIRVEDSKRLVSISALTCAGSRIIERMEASEE